MRASVAPILVLAAICCFPEAAYAYDDRAFQEGSGQSGADFRALVTLVFHSTLMLIAAWTVFCLIREWMDGNLGQRQTLINTIRMIGLVLLLGVFVR